MGSPSDEKHCTKIAKHCHQLDLECHLRCTSAHKGTQDTLQILADYEGMWMQQSHLFHIYVDLSEITGK